MAMKKEKKGPSDAAIAFGFCGDGATSEPDFHVAMTFAATSPMNITYQGTLQYIGGTGKFRRVRGSGTIECTTSDGGAHKSCTVKSKLTGL